MVGLSQVAHRHVGEFSKGMMRRIGLAQALINDPEFLILDEPRSEEHTSELQSRRNLVCRLLLEKKKKKKTKSQQLTFAYNPTTTPSSHSRLSNTTS